MKTPDIPSIKGITKMSALEMNSVHFNKNHTVLTPELLASLTKEKNGVHQKESNIQKSQG